jgi:hypothetical protein
MPTTPLKLSLEDVMNLEDEFSATVGPPTADVGPPNKKEAWSELELNETALVKLLVKTGIPKDLISAELRRMSRRSYGPVAERVRTKVKRRVRSGRRATRFPKG